MSVAEFQGQYYNPKDLEKFSEGCHVNVTVDKNVGGNEPGDGVESELDINQALEQIEALLFDEPKLAEMASCSKRQGRTEVAAQVAEILISRFGDGSR